MKGEKAPLTFISRGEEKSNNVFFLLLQPGKRSSPPGKGGGEKHKLLANIFDKAKE